MTIKNNSTKALAIAFSVLIANSVMAANYNIDALMLYDTASRNALGGTSQMKAKIRAIVESANQIFTDSNIDVQVSIIWPHELPTPASEPTVFSIFSPGYSTSRTDMDTIGADYIVFVTDLNGVAGYAGLGGVSTVLDTANGLLGTVVGHEIGHSCNLPHSEGHVFVGDDGRTYRTLMERNRGPGVNIPRFSSPNQNFQGVPLGTNSNNSVAKIVPRYKAIAAFKQLKPQNGPASLQWSITSRTTGRAITMRGENTETGTFIEQYDYLGQDNQVWYPRGANNNVDDVRFFSPLRQNGAARYIGMNGTANGSGATLEAWSQNRTMFNLEHTAGGWVQLKNINSGKVLYPSGSENSAQLKQWQDNNQSSTQWQFQTVN